MAEKSNPKYDVFSIAERKGQPNWWTKIGAAFPFTAKNGEEGLQIQLNALPLEGSLTLLPWKPPKVDEAAK